jgi:hypothetical protein
MKIKTIWHYAFAFFKSEKDLQEAYDIYCSPIYKGKIDKLPYETASKIAQIHPNCISYYNRAMMPLFQGKGKTYYGTENPVLALESYKTKSELQGNFSYIVIWKIFNT